MLSVKPYVGPHLTDLQGPLLVWMGMFEIEPPPSQLQLRARRQSQFAELKLVAEEWQLGKPGTNWWLAVAFHQMQLRVEARLIW